MFNDLRKYNKAGKKACLIIKIERLLLFDWRK